MEITPEAPSPDGSGEHLIDDIDYTLYQAASGRRLANYIVDNIIFYLTWRFFLFRPIVSLLVLVREYTQSTVALYVAAYVVILTWSISLNAMLETFTGGKTIGKFITRTRAVNEDGTRITARTAILRSLSRLVPFEAFSALGTPSYPWHDRWTKTYVVDERLSSLPAPQS